MEWPEITADTPLEEVKRIHQMIWNYVIVHREKPVTPYENNCAFCEYGYQVAKDKNDYDRGLLIDGAYNMCKYCPGDWTHEDVLPGSDFACERNYGLFYRWNHLRHGTYKEDTQDITRNLAKRIRDIPIRKDI